MSRQRIWTALIVAVFTAFVLTSSPWERETETTTASYTTSTEASSTTSAIPHVVLGGVKIFVEIADDTQERSRGLSGRTGLEDGWGMLFVFEEPGRHSFWMYGMLFPLDIIWIDGDGVIVYVVENATPCGSVCESYTPNADAKYVLEVGAGLLKELGVGVGDVVSISLPSQPSPAR